ncbi:MAG TPA: DNA polymerase subunit beta [Gallionellaceae bacterium]|nr:DNA polymerase subunit beta [Gallionellaceae bacterium]
MSNNTNLLDMLFGAYRQRVLSLLLLQPEQRFHVRELARRTETAPGTLHRELAKLAVAGLLVREQQGNQVLYRANRACPVFEELAGLFRKTSGAVSVLQQALQGLSPQIRFALLFGSLARGTETPGSDVDVMIVGDAGFAEVVKALYPAQELLRREINPVVYSASEFLLRLQNKEPLLLGVLSKPRLFLLGSEYDFAEFAVHQ